MVSKPINLTELSRETGVPKQTIHNWLCGTEPKTLDHVRSVAKYFGLTIEDLCYGDTDKAVKKVLKNPMLEHEEEIMAGIFEVVLRRVKR